MTKNICKYLTKTVLCILILCVFCGVSPIFAQNNNKNPANRKTAERCLRLAETYIINNNWQGALTQAELGLSYDNSISDLYFIKANSLIHQNPRPVDAEVLKVIKLAFDKNDWINYNKNSARILYADLLSNTKQLEESQKILNDNPLIYSADAEFIRIKNLYRKGTNDSISEARTKLSTARKIYPNDQRFPSLFFTFETLFLTNAERNGVKYSIPEEVKHIAENYIVKFPDYSTKDVEMEIMASMFSSGERQKRLIKAIGEKNQKSPLFAVAGLKAGVISEEKAFNLFFDHSNNNYPLILLEDFASLITDSNLKKTLYDHLNSFEGNLIIDEDLDLCNELVVSYNRGRAQSIYYDKNNDGIQEILCDCDFGVPYRIMFGNTNTELSYDIYPVVKTINRLNDKIVYNFIDDDYAFSPFEMIANPAFTKLGVNFFVPYVNDEISEPLESVILTKVNSIEVPVTERDGAFAKYTIHKGIPVLIYFYDALGNEYAFANLQSGYPFTRFVDYDNDNQYETSELYDYDENGLYYTEEDKNLIEKTFGNISMNENLYLKKVEIDKDNDTIIDFKEEYTGNGGKISSWDSDGNGLWDSEYIRYPIEADGNLVEETVIYNNSNTSKIIVKNINGIPVNLNYKNTDYAVIPGTKENYYWIQAKGTENEEKVISAKIGNNILIATVQMVTFESKRFTAIRIGNMIFCKNIPQSAQNTDFNEFVNE